MSINKIKSRKPHQLPLAEPLLVRFFGNINILQYENGNIYQKLDSESSIKLKVLKGTSIKELEHDTIAVIYDDENFRLNTNRKCKKCSIEVNLTEFEKIIELEQNELFQSKFTEIKEYWLNPEIDIYCKDCNNEIDIELNQKIIEKLTHLSKINPKVMDSLINIFNCKFSY